MGWSLLMSAEERYKALQKEVRRCRRVMGLKQVLPPLQPPAFALARAAGLGSEGLAVPQLDGAVSTPQVVAEPQHPVLVAAAGAEVCPLHKAQTGSSCHLQCLSKCRNLKPSSSAVRRETGPPSSATSGSSSSHTGSQLRWDLCSVKGCQPSTRSW